MHSLKDYLIERLQKEGPLCVSEFLKEVLYHPQWGYYTTQSDILGAKGDFITAPEISQLFGETIALAFLQHWQFIGSPRTPIQFLELGPGRGTLMADMYRVFKKFPTFVEQLNIKLYEISPFLREAQNKLLKTIMPNDSFTHIQSFDELDPTCLTFIIANEYFDALPIELKVYDHRLKKLVDQRIDFDSKTSDFVFLYPDADECVESCPLMNEQIMHLKPFLNNGGLGIFIDYGDISEKVPRQTTLQAVYQHQKVDLFDHLGKADLSHHVNFTEMMQAFSPLSCTVTTQHDFLTTFGILDRMHMLGEKNPEKKKELTYGVMRLIAPSCMGELFKVCSVSY